MASLRYLCIRDGEERGFTACEYKAAQAEGWEKQYQYKVGKKKIHMPPSAAEAQGYERVNKYPKSTKFGRQNPITERWNSEEQLVLWRQVWAETASRHLERSGVQERIDHRSHAERNITEQPTIHEGVTARALEKKGILSDRCDLNRQIREDNKLLRELKAQVQKLMEAVKNTVPAIAAALEKLRASMLVFRYQLRFVGKSKAEIRKTLNAVLPDFRRYSGVVQQIRDKTRERKDLLSEKKETPIFRVPRHMELAPRITTLTEELEELHSEKAMLLARLNKADDTGMKQIQQQVDRMEHSLKNLEQAESKYTIELNNTLAEYYTLDKHTAECDPAELSERRRTLRVAESRTAREKLQAAYGDRYDGDLLRQADADVSRLLDENAPAWKRASVRAQLQKQQQPKPKDKQKNYEQER
jgi:predicted  nucleic acid-binding Zn-ribbon protein